MTDSTEAVRRLVDAANARDWEALLAVCAPDVTLIHPLAPVPYRDAEGVREFFVTSADALPDQFLHLDAVLSEGDVAALTPCAFFFTLRDGLIHQIRMYYDTATFNDEYDDDA